MGEAAERMPLPSRDAAPPPNRRDAARPPTGCRIGRGAGFFNPPLALTWSWMRGPAAPKFDPVKPSIDANDGGKATTTVTFSEPGEYLTAHRRQRFDRLGRRRIPVLLDDRARRGIGQGFSNPIGAAWLTALISTRLQTSGTRHGVNAKSA